MREQGGGLPERLTAAARFPFLHCWIPDSLADQGIGWVVVSREAPQGRVAVATFLVDGYCLGVKNVVVDFLGRPSYDEKYTRRMRHEMPSRLAPPAEARKLLEGAVAYARELGLPPHPDYPTAMLIFGDVKAADSDAVFEFGKDGKPFFVAGPNDSPERCRRVMAILTNTRGPGRFEYLIPLADPGALVGLDEGEEEFDELEDLGEDEG